MNNNKNTLLAIGEALIDFMPEESGIGISKVNSFIPKVGGAPANVCGAFSKLGGKSKMITQLGNDPFGDKIIDEFIHYNIDCSAVKRTDKANTALAFVALKDRGNREFSFYRKPSADMLLSGEDIKEKWFDDAFCLHFCSVSLGDFPMREAHKRAIELARKKGALVSFDPNLRRALWNDDEALYKAVWEFIPMADVIKISDEELEFITGFKNIEGGVGQLFKGNIKMVVFTRGKNGAVVYTKNAFAETGEIKVTPVDTTGAGDGFIGSFLYKLWENGINGENIENIGNEMLKEFIEFSNMFCSISIMNKGAINSYPNKLEYDKISKNLREK